MVVSELGKLILTTVKLSCSEVTASKSPDSFGKRVDCVGEIWTRLVLITRPCLHALFCTF